jgi:hypothetical protein
MFSQEMDTTHEKEAFLKIQNLNYLKNNEYYGYMADGYTQFGIQLNPQLGYQLSKNLSIEAGMFLSKDFGNKDFNNVDPTFSLRYHKKDFKMIFGNLNGSLNHRLIEPLYNFERVMTNRLEGGLQFMLNKPYYDFDVWADWQNMIYKGSNGAEKVWGGLSSHPLKLKRNQLEFKIPFQVTILHSGGQIDTSNGSMFTNWNYNAGAALTYTPASGPFQQFILDARYVGNVHYLFTPAQSEKDGYGVLANAGLHRLRYRCAFLLLVWLQLSERLWWLPILQPIFYGVLFLYLPGATQPAHPEAHQKDPPGRTREPNS